MPSFNTMIKRASTAMFAGALALGITPFASAQEGKVTKFVVPFPAGGGTDTLARVLGRKLQAELGDTVVIENKPGAGGNIALDYVAASPPDGKTLVLITNSLVINPLIYSSTKFDPKASFSPIAMLATSPVLLVAKPDLPVQSMADLIKYAKANPGKLSYASCGNGSIHQLAAELMKSMAGVQILHIPYKGCGPAMTDVAGGQVDLSMNSLTSAASFIEGKRVKALAVTAEKPSALLPNVPTIASAGLPGFAFDGWYAMLAPANTPPAIVNRINAAVNKAIADEEVQKAMRTGYLEPVGGSAASLASTINSEIARYKQIIAAGNIQGD